MSTSEAASIPRVTPQRLLRRRAFNDHFGNIPWEDADRVHELITEVIPSRVAEDTAYRNARKNSDKQNARIEQDVSRSL